MNLIPGKTEFSDAEHRDLAAQIKQMVAGGLVQAELAREADIPVSSLSQYLGGKYPSENGRNDIAAKLTRWRKAREAEAELRGQLPLAPSFIRLRGSKTITAALAYARETGRIVQVIGVPGVSKTATSRQFAEDYPRTWYVPMNPTTGGVPTMLPSILRAMGERDAKGTPLALLQRVCDRAQEAKGLLVIDEAQHLSPSAIEALRAINDAVRLGIAMLGNEVAGARLGPTGSKPEFAQVSSRISMRKFFAHPDPADAADLAEAWAAANREEITAREVRFCQEIAARPGGLRNIEMTMEAALMACRGAREPLGLEHLKGAFAQLSGDLR